MRRIGLVLLAILSALLAVGQASAATRPHYGGTLRLEVRARPASLDPRVAPADPAQATAQEKLLLLVFDRLVMVDEKGRPQPALAVSWQHDEDSKRWNFRLRQNVRFSDGSALTPSAAAVALQAALGINRAVSVSAEELVIESSQPIPNLLAELAGGRNFIFHADSDGVPSGTGPFRVAQWPAEGGAQTAVFVANEECWAGRPFVDSIVVRMGVPLTQQLVDLELEQADVAEVGPDQVRRATQEGVRTWSSAPVELLALVLDPARPSLEDDRLRGAIALSIDRSAIANVLLQRQAEPAGSLLPQWLSGYAFLFSTSPDAERARKLVAAAEAGGVSRARPLLLVYDSGDPQAQTVAERVAVNAGAVGITMQVSATGASGGNADLRLARRRVDSTDACLALEALLGSVGETLSTVPGATPDALYAAERAPVEAHRVVPLVFLPETFGLGAQVRDWMPLRWGSWRLADLWLAPIGQPAPNAEKP